MEAYPALEHNGHRAMMGYLLFTTFRGKDNRPILHAPKVASCYGVEDYERIKKNIVIERMLELFRDEVLPDFKWTGWLPAVAAREAYELGVRSDLIERLDLELHTRPGELQRPVSWMEGRRINKKFITNMRKQSMTRAQAEASEGVAELSRRFIDYLNARSPRLFREQVRPRLADAWQVANKMTPRRKERQAKRQLRAIGGQPMPIYFPQKRSVRINAPNSLASIDSRIRKQLCAGWVEYDLSSAQLAIAASRWNVEPIVDFLESGGSVWQSISEHTGLGMEWKGVMKVAVYACVYGSTRGNILRTHMKEEAREKGLPYNHERGQRILSHPVFEEIIEPRNEQLEQIREEGGRMDVFGRWMSMKRFAREKGGGLAAARSILACEMQAIEMSLLEPALELAEEEEEKSRASWQIALFQHDGFSVKFHRSEAHHHSRIVEAVNEKCAAEGYPTHLEHEAL